MSDTMKSNNRNGSIDNTFHYFVFHEKRNKMLLLIALVGSILQFIIFKVLYPFPDFISDSWSYIATNIYRMDVNLWPIGYSKFLWIVHQISHSDTFLIAVQYLILETCLFYFFITINYLYRPPKISLLILFIFLLFNPMFLYLSNCVLSDALFSSLTLVFLAQFLHMLNRPTISQVLIQGIIIGIAFTIRYTAIYYPFIAITGLLLARHKPITKIWGALIGLALMLPFILYTKQKTKEITGTAEFSVFGGWQIANNALYMYDHISVDSNKLPYETRSLDRMSRKFFEKTPPSSEELAALPGTYFIKVPWAILKPYMAYRYAFANPKEQFWAWGQVSPVYNKYGSYLITHYPIDFVRYYLWLNTKNYFLPHLEKFGSYNVEISTVPPDVQDWFDYITPDVYAVSVNFQGKLFYIYPILFSTLNVYFVVCIAWILLTGRFRKLNPHSKLTLIFASIFLSLNFGFSVFATPVVLRYQVVPLIILFTFTLLLPHLLDNTNKLNKF